MARTKAEIKSEIEQIEYELNNGKHLPVYKFQLFLQVKALKAELLLAKN